MIKRFWRQDHAPHIIAGGIVVLLFLLLVETRFVEDGIYLATKLGGGL